MDPLRGGRFDPFVEAPSATDPRSGQDGVMDLVQKLAGPLDLMTSSVSPGVVLVVGSEAGQAKLEELLGKVRDLYRESFEVEVLAVAFPANQAPALGAELSGGKILMRSHQAVALRTPTAVVSTEEIQYIAGWQPIVADNSVGYQLIPASVSNGIRCVVIVGAEEAAAGAKPGGTPIRIQGTVSVASMTEKNFEVTVPSGKTVLTIGLPRVQERTIDSSATVGTRGEAGPTVIAVINGFEQDQLIVIGANVRRRPSGN